MAYLFLSSFLIFTLHYYLVFSVRNTCASLLNLAFLVKVLGADDAKEAPRIHILKCYL